MKDFRANKNKNMNEMCKTKKAGFNFFFSKLCAIYSDSQGHHLLCPHLRVEAAETETLTNYEEGADCGLCVLWRYLWRPANRVVD